MTLEGTVAKKEKKVQNYTFINQFIISNYFIMVNFKVNREPIPGNTQVGLYTGGVTLGQSLGTMRTHTHTHLLITDLFLGGGKNLEYPEKTHTDRT